jgi:hypothetical protein
VRALSALEWEGLSGEIFPYADNRLGVRRINLKSSCAALTRASTPFFRALEGVDARERLVSHIERQFVEFG